MSVSSQASSAYRRRLSRTATVNNSETRKPGDDAVKHRPDPSSGLSRGRGAAVGDRQGPGERGGAAGGRRGGSTAPDPAGGSGAQVRADTGRRVPAWSGAARGRRPRAGVPGRGEGGTRHTRRTPSAPGPDQRPLRAGGRAVATATGRPRAAARGGGSGLSRGLAGPGLRPAARARRDR